MKNVETLRDETVAAISPQLARMNGAFFAVAIVAVILGGIIATIP